MTVSTVRLGDITNYIRGITFKPADVLPAHSPNSVVCMTTKNVQETLDETKLTAVPPRFVKRDEQYLQPGDILISSANSWNLVGKASFVPELTYPAAAGGFISILRARHKVVDSRYLYNWMASGETQHQARLCARQTTNIANLDRERFLKLEIPLPPLPEQRRIAAILDKADAVRRKRQQTIDLADQFLRSAFLDLFGDPVTNPKGWEITSIGTHIKVMGGFAFKSADFAEEGLPIVRISNLAGDSINLSSCALIPSSALLKGARFRLQPGDTLIAMSGATTGKLGFVPDDLDEEWYLNQRVGAFRVSQDSMVQRDYLRSLLRSSFYQYHVWNLAGGAAQPNISGKQLESALIPLPPLDLQHHFAAIVESIEQQMIYQRAHLAKLDLLFASLQQRAFRGEL